MFKKFFKVIKAIINAIVDAGNTSMAFGFAFIVYGAIANFAGNLVLKVLKLFK